MKRLYTIIRMRSVCWCRNIIIMVDKLDESIEQLSRSERENAWREMARQIAMRLKIH